MSAEKITSQTSQQKIFLEVPFSEKDTVKALGGRWDGEARKWFIPIGIKQEPFEKRMPRTLTKDQDIELISPYYLIESLTDCWRRGKETAVIMIGSQGFIEEGQAIHDFATCSFVELMPSQLENFIKNRFPSFKKSFSKTTNSFYFMNHCSCGAHFGDFYLHDEPGAPFFPTDASAAKEISLYELQYPGPLLLACSIGMSSEDLILKYAQRKGTLAVL